MTKGLQHLWIGFVLLALVLAGCGSGQPGPADGGANGGGEGGVEVRVANRSDRDFDRVDVTFQSNKVEYGALARGATSEYRQVNETAYRYALVEITAGGQTFRLQPIDFVGETPLAPGRYTYGLNIDPSDNMVTIDLVED